MLPSSAIGDKTHVKAWSERVAQYYDSLRVFSCPTYYHVKEDKLDPRAEKMCVHKIQERLQILRSEGQEAYLE